MQKDEFAAFMAETPAGTWVDVIIPGEKSLDGEVKLLTGRIERHRNYDAILWTAQVVSAEEVERIERHSDQKPFTTASFG